MIPVHLARAEDHRASALRELREELAHFVHDGLVQLREDLERGTVTRGSWGGCVLSYQRGASGSVRRDRLGRARNAFTIQWDRGWITDEEVVRLIDAELRSRYLDGLEATLPRPAPAIA